MYSHNHLKIAKDLNINPILILLLEKRGITTRESIISFLQPSLNELPRPSEMKGMAKAASLIVEAIETSTDIIIWGDYDVDGVTGTCLLMSFFQSIGVKSSFFIPNRFNDGYGLNIDQLKKLKNNSLLKNPLLITVDCGISNIKEISFAKEIGFSVIVTDHHEPGHTISEADAILNPKQSNCSFLEKNLSGVGVAFYLAAGIRAKLLKTDFFNKGVNIPILKNLMDLVAVGTIADMVPLTPVNRILVKGGFEVLSTDPREGFRELLTRCDINQGDQLTTDDISFNLAPKINAAGRMEDANIAAKLLISKDKKESKKLAQQLERLNNQRKKICSDILEDTLTFRHNELYQHENFVILTGEFNLGIIGIIASQLVNKLNVPVILLTETTDNIGKSILKGSGRSVNNINLFSCISDCKELLITFGGHKMAAGLSLSKENLNHFIDLFSQSIELWTKDNVPIIESQENIQIPVDMVFAQKTPEQLLLLEPFGEGNEKPIFLDNDPIIIKSQTLGSNSEHLKLWIRGKYNTIEAIGFGLGEKEKIIKEKKNVKMFYSTMINRYRKRSNWKVKIIDII